MFALDILVVVTVTRWSENIVKMYMCSRSGSEVRRCEYRVCSPNWQTESYNFKLKIF